MDLPVPLSRGPTPPPSAAASSPLVFLPEPGSALELLCVCLYLSLAAISACRAMSLPTRYSAYEVKRRHTFQQLMVAFALTRTASFLAQTEMRDLLHRAALCLFFSLVLFQVLFWIDIANPKISSRSKRIWHAFTVANTVFYVLVLGVSAIHVWYGQTAQWVVTGIFPVLLIAVGNLASAIGLIYATWKLRRRVGRVLKANTENHTHRRLDDRVAIKLRRALLFTNWVMIVCSIIFSLRTFMYLRRSISHQTCGIFSNVNTCIAVGYALPEVLPCVCFLILMWEVEPDLRFPSRRRPSLASGYSLESTPLLCDDQPNQQQITIRTIPTTPITDTLDPQDSFPDWGSRKKNRRTSPLSLGLGKTVVEQARRRQKESQLEQASGDGKALSSLPSVSLQSVPKGSNRLSRRIAAQGNIQSQSSMGKAQCGLGGYGWLSFQCFHLRLPTQSSFELSSFVVLHVVDADTGNVVGDIGRSEVSTSTDPCFHVMLAVEMKSADLLRASVYFVRNFEALDDLNAQWLVGDALFPLTSLAATNALPFGRAVLHQLFSPLSRSQSSGELVVRCEADVKSTNGVADDGRERITRSFMYFSAEEQQQHAILVDQRGKEPNQSNHGNSSMQNCSGKMLVEEELIESVYTWEIPYQLLQLVLSDLLVKLDALKREIGSDECDEQSESLTSTPSSQLSNTSSNGLTIPAALPTSPSGLHPVLELEAGEQSFVSEDGERDSLDYGVHQSGILSGETKRLYQPKGKQSSIGMLSEMIYQIQDDAMERMKRKWRLELISKMEQYISRVEDAIVRYGDPQHGGLTFKPSTMKADQSLSFLALNLHQQLMTVGNAVPTSENDVHDNDYSRGERYARLVNTFIGTIIMSPSHRLMHEPSSHNIGNLDDHGVEGDNYFTSEEYESDIDEVEDEDVYVRERKESESSPLEPVEALRRRVISFDSAENIVNMSVAGCEPTVPVEQRKLAETVVALGISGKDLLGNFTTSDEKTVQPSIAEPVNSIDSLSNALSNGPLKGVITVSGAFQPFRHFHMYGTTTVGAFAAHIYGFKQGGVRQMREELERLRLRLVKEAENSSSDLTLEALERKYHELKWLIDRRLEVAFCQSMSSLVTCFQQTLYVHLHGDAPQNGRKLVSLEYLEMVAQVGFLFSVESLLSTYSNEAGMLGDMEAAVKELGRVRIKLKPVQSPQAAGFRVSVSSSRSGIIVELPLIICDPDAYPARSMHRIPGQDALTGAVYCPLYTDEQRECMKRILRRNIRVVPVLFSQGMNEMQTVANTVGTVSLQKEINAENVEVLEKHFAKFSQWHNKQHQSTLFGGAQDLERMKLIMERLQRNVANSGRTKRMAILSLSSSLARSMGGGRVTCCKSAKDRTSMSVTLEQANLLVNTHGLPADERPQFTNVLRTHGVRRENARKNIGKAQYCFSALQNYMLPQDYKCPPGTGGGSRAKS